MKRSIFTNLIVLSLISVGFAVPYPGWTPLITGIHENLHSVYFFNSDTGWAAGPKTLIKTTDGGLSWSSITVDPTARISDMFFISPDTGWALINAPYYTRGTIIGTTDGGISWDTLWSQPEHKLLTLFFINSQIGWVGTEWSIPFTSEGRLFKTDDGGLNWTNIYISGSEINSIYFLDLNNGHILSHFYETGWYEYGNIHNTTNGGNSWTTWNNSITGWHWFNKIFFFNADTGWVIGGGELIYAEFVLKTINVGIDWNIVYIDSSRYFNDIIFVSSNIGWIICNYGQILKSINGGITWELQESGTNNDLFDMFFLNPDTGWIAGENGLILKTTSGGLTGITQKYFSPLNITDDFILYQNFPNPFNSNTNISFYLKKESIVELKVFDITGELVKVLLNENRDQGFYSIYFDADLLPTGIYVYRLKIAGVELSRKMLLLE